MPKELKDFDIEKIFKREDYNEFRQAVEKRQAYEFLYAKAGTYLPHQTTDVYFKIGGTECDNGIWKDNYLYSIDCWRGNGGCGVPFDPVEDGILTYSEIVNLLYEWLKIPQPQQKQVSLFDMVME